MVVREVDSWRNKAANSEAESKSLKNQVDGLKASLKQETITSDRWKERYLELRKKMDPGSRPGIIWDRVPYQDSSQNPSGKSDMLRAIVSDEAPETD